MRLTDRVYVAGHAGLVGSAVVRRLKDRGHTDILVATHGELDLTRQVDVERFMRDARPKYVIVAAAKVGGIMANDRCSAEFIHDNLAIESNLIHTSWKFGAEKLCLLGSSCIYPKHAEQPIKESSLLAGPLEPTNSAYAVAKIAGIEMARAYRKQYGMNCICPMPTNLYGPNDRYDLETAHVLPALLRKVHEAKRTGQRHVTVWGTGKPRREFLHVDDLARAILWLMDYYDESEIINVGVGEDTSILELAQLIARVVGYDGGIEMDATKPDGTPRKVLDVSRIHALGWHACIPLLDGLRETYAWYQREVG